MEGSRERVDNSRTAAPLPPKAPDPCPSRPANGGTDNRQKRAGRRRFQLLNPEDPEEGHPPPPPGPTLKPEGYQSERKKSTTLTACQEEQPAGKPPRSSQSPDTEWIKTQVEHDQLDRQGQEVQQKPTTPLAGGRRRHITAATERKPPRETQQGSAEQEGCSPDPQGKPPGRRRGRRSKEGNPKGEA